MRDAPAVGRPDAPSPAGGRPRRNLILLRGGDQSLHPSWFAEGPRDFDLHISFYGKGAAPALADTGALTWSKEGGAGKYHGIAACVGSGAVRLDDYDYIAIPDDDLVIDQGAWNRAFALAAAYDLAACQLSLHHGSYFSLGFTLRRPHLRLRYVSRIELMAPILRMDAFKQLLPYLRLERNMWAIDHVLANLYAGHSRALAVLDEVYALHTRAVGTGAHYDGVRAAGVTPHEIEAAFLAEHGFRAVPAETFAAIARNGRPIEGAWRIKRYYPWPRLLARLRQARRITSLVSGPAGRRRLIRRFAGVRPLPGSP